MTSSPRARPPTAGVNRRERSGVALAEIRSAVDVQRLTGDVARLAASEIDAGRADILATAHRAQRDARQYDLALLFVPAGVGVVRYGSLIGEEWLAISVALLGSTAATLAATAIAMRLLLDRRR